MSRTTMKQLEAAVERLNEVTENPTTYSNRDNGKFTVHIGHYHIDQCYGGYQLVQTCTEGGGVRTIQPCRGTKTDCYNAIWTVLNIEYNKQR